MPRLSAAFHQVSDQTDCFEPASMEQEQNLTAAVALRERLDETIDALARDVRRQLGYEDLPRPKKVE